MLEEDWPWMKLNVEHLKFFHCITLMHILDEKHAKLDPNNINSIYVSYSSEFKGYRVYDPINKSMYVTRVVIFDDNKFGTTNELDVDFVCKYFC